MGVEIEKLQMQDVVKKASLMLDHEMLECALWLRLPETQGELLNRGSNRELLKDLKRAIRRVSVTEDVFYKYHKEWFCLGNFPQEKGKM